MRAHQFMTRNVVTVTPRTSVEDAANIMLQNHISGLPVVDNGKLTGIVSESDFMRRSEIGTGRKRSAFLQFLLGPGRAAADFVHERGRKIEDVMTLDPVTVEEQTPLEQLVHLMEKKDIKRLPAMRGRDLVGIVTRSNLLQAVASLAHEIPDPDRRRRSYPRSYPPADRRRELASYRVRGDRLQRRCPSAWHRHQ
ncbi:CBS domain-containing protein [Bradyrhizobium sp. USDA 4341]